MFLHRNDQKMTTFNYFGPRILFVRPERTVGNNGLRCFIEIDNFDRKYNRAFRIAQKWLKINLLLV